MDQEAVENLLKKMLSEQLNICAEWVFSLDDNKCNESINGNPFIEIIKYSRKHFNQLLRERDEEIKTLNEKIILLPHFFNPLIGCVQKQNFQKEIGPIRKACAVSAS